MTSSLFAALSGLRAHQDWINVIGNNLANSNTPGFKASRATFSDQFTRTLQYATAPGTNTGGRNPVQVGQGVQVTDVARSFLQGALTATGRAFDMAIQGGGFFVLTNGSTTAYTRVGTFGLDASRNLVDQRTGMRVVSPSGQPLNLDVDALFPPSPTLSMDFSGNLPGEVTGPLEEQLVSGSALAEGAPAQLTGTSTAPPTIPVGEVWSLDVVVNGAAPVTASVTGTGAPITVNDVASAIDALDGVSATVVAGEVQVTSDRKGESISLQIQSGPSGRDLNSFAGLPTTLVNGSQAPVDATTDLNLLPGNLTEYTSGDTIEVSGLDTDGSAISGSFTYGTDGTTVGEFVDYMNGLYTDAVVSLDASGRIQVEAQTAGESSLRLSIDDGSSSTGETQWSLYSLSVATEGTGPDTVTTSTEIYDPTGSTHTVTFTFERQQDETWNLQTSLSPEAGTVLSPTITGLSFNDNGSPAGLGGLDNEVVIQFNGQSQTQSVNIDFGEDGGFSGMTQFGSESNVWVSDQDGYGVGELTSISVDSEGGIQGFYSNGQFGLLGSVGIATFANVEGLQELGENLWIESPNSGARVLGRGATRAAGEVIGGSIETSNVDTAEQFVRLIEAQRGYQANARVISTQNEVLAELVNII